MRVSDVLFSYYFLDEKGTIVISDRDDILKTINQIKPQILAMAEHGRFRNTEVHRVRVAYLNALIRLLDLENKILESKELDYIIGEIEKLKSGE